jgi:hypothetical protein
VHQSHPPTWALRASAALPMLPSTTSLNRVKYTSTSLRASADPPSVSCTQGSVSHTHVRVHAKHADKPR